MWQFIISGYVPGTNFQITFDVIINFVIILIGLLIIRTEIKRQLKFHRQITKIINHSDHIQNISL